MNSPDTREQDLNLPDFSGKMLPPRTMSMDEIVECLDEDYRLFFDRESYEREKKIKEVAAAFVL